MTLVDSHQFAPEERGFTHLYGEISRPFSPSLRAGPQTRVQKIKEIFYSSRVAAFGVTEWEVEGIDVSAWQGTMNWRKARELAQFAILRAGYGNSWVDTQLNSNVVGCTDVEMSFGQYWFIKPDRDWRKHAEAFAATYAIYKGNLHPTADVEVNGGLNKTNLESWLYKFVSKFEDDTGVKMMIYTSPGFWNSNMPLTSWAKERLLWDAHWTNASLPIQPYDWTPKNNPDKYPWEFWQWTSKGDGLAHGAESKSIDKNRYHFSAEQFEQSYGEVITPPDPPIPPLSRDMKFQVRSDVQPHLNVRTGPGTNYADIGDLAPNTIFQIQNVGGSNAWVQIKGGEYDGRWVCVELNARRYCEPIN